MDNTPSRAGGSIPRNGRDRADEVIGRALKRADDLVTILEHVAEHVGVYDRDWNIWNCAFCDGGVDGPQRPSPDDIEHADDCPVSLARRLLGRE